MASLSASCQSPCSVVSESMTAHQILQSSSFGEQSHPMRVAAGASGCTPASVCFPLRSGIWAAVRHEPQATAEAGAQATVIHADCFLLFFSLQPPDIHPLRSLQQLKHSDLIKLSHQSYLLIPKWLHVASWCWCSGRSVAYSRYISNHVQFLQDWLIIKQMMKKLTDIPI